MNTTKNHETAIRLQAKMEMILEDFPPEMTPRLRELSANVRKEDPELSEALFSLAIYIEMEAKQ